jgi:chromosome segregation ATPase
MVSSPAPSTRLARAVSQRRLQRKEQSPVKQQQDKTTISTTTGVDVSHPSPSKNWWIQGGIGSSSTDDMTVSSQSVVSNLTNGTGMSNLSAAASLTNGTGISTLSAAASRRRQRRAQQKDVPPTDQAPALNVSFSSNSMNSHPPGVPKTVETPRRTNSSSSIFSLAQKRVSGSDAAITTANDNVSAASVSSPTPLKTAVHNSRSTSNQLVKLTEDRDKLQEDVKLFQRKAKSATEAKYTAEKERNEAISFMENQIVSLEEKLRAVTEQMSKVQINEKAVHEKQLNDSQSNVSMLRKQVKQMAAVIDGLVEKGTAAEKTEKAMAEMKRKMARMKSEHDSVVESLRRDLVAANKIRDDKRSSFQNDIEVLKRSHTKEVSFYKEEIEEFKQQLKIAMEIGDADRSGVKEIERKLAESKNKNTELVKQLKQAQDAANRLKSNRENDMQLLESELDKTHKAKVAVEHELKETKRQLASALQNLDEMTLDGEKMHSNVEGMMADFTKEKANFQKEITVLKRDKEDKMTLIDELRREKIAVDIDSKNLQQNVSDLEMKLRGAEKFIADLENEVESLKGKKSKNAPEHAITEIMNVNELRADKAKLQNQLDSNNKSLIELRQTNRDISMKLSKAEQTIHKLISKEKYLESRVESLSNQISKTVHDYEMKLVNCERR